MYPPTAIAREMRYEDDNQ
jgi:hypothetical protein